MNKVSDQTIIQKVTRQLSNRGMQSPCHIAVVARRGAVTLSGTIQYEHQRLAALHAARGVDGVRQVMDQLHVESKNQPQKFEPRQKTVNGPDRNLVGITDKDLVVKTEQVQVTKKTEQAQVINEKP
jgi:hypothetical protein